MEIFRFNILPLEEIERREALKKAINNCPHCGSPMQFSTEVDFNKTQVKVDSFCQSCTTNISSEFHSLQ